MGACAARTQGASIAALSESATKVDIGDRAIEALVEAGHAPIERHLHVESSFAIHPRLHRSADGVLTAVALERCEATVQQLLLLFS